MSEDAVRAFIRQKIREAAARKGVDFDSIGENENLFQAEVLDSLGFLELVGAVESQFDLEVDFSEMDPSEFTTIKGLTLLCENASHSV